jgi:hypothetical protein
MRHLISQLVSQVRVLLAPGGRHQAECPAPPPRADVFRPASSVRAWYEPIDGQATALVRPYPRVHERYDEARAQRQRRRALWFATYGIDLDGRDVHATGVVA